MYFKLLPSYSMKLFFGLLFLLSSSCGINAQFLATNRVTTDYSSYTLPEGNVAIIPKLHQRNSGAVLGIQRGRYTSLELGGEAHWRKISLKKSHITGATVVMEYNPFNNIIGYKAGMWMKRGRVNLTYGGNLVFFNDYKGKSRYGLAPSIGFRLAGFHLVNSYNILGGDKDLSKVNTLHLSLRYFFPVDNKFTWDRKENNDKEDRQKERAKKKRKKEREKDGKKKLFPF
jgi:hypothetical protein